VQQIGDRLKLTFITHLERDIFFRYKDIIKSVDGSKFEPEEKCWTIPRNKSNVRYLISRFGNENLDIEPTLITQLETTEVNYPKESRFTEIFFINEAEIPDLDAYELKIHGQNLNSIGGKFSYQLRKKFKGHWIWSENKIITDSPKKKEEIMQFIEELWSYQPETYQDLIEINHIPLWKPTAYSKANFASKGIFSDYESKINKTLSKETVHLGNARIERKIERRAWIIQGKPAISISIKSALIYKNDLNTTIQNMAEQNEIIGLYVADKISTLKGEIIDIVGNVKEHGKRLLTLTKKKRMQDIISKAPDNELVIRVKASNRFPYEYVASALNIVLRMQDFEKFNINSKKALKNLQITPDKRFEVLSKISSLLISDNLISHAINSKENQDLFLNSESIGFKPLIQFNDGVPINYIDKNVLRDMKNHGIFRTNIELITIGVINGIPGNSFPSFWTNLERELKELSIKFKIVEEVKVEELTRINIEKTVHKLVEVEKLDIIIALVPDNLEDRIYNQLKELTLNRNIASQIVEKTTINNKFALGNIILGILGKIGNIPYALAEPLPYADYIVGIDIAREKKRVLPGTINATAIIRIYMSNGEMMHYQILDVPIEGETIPDTVLESLFPYDVFNNKKVVIHRDGYFRGQEKDILLTWAIKIKAIFHLVEVIKTGSPRVYSLKGNEVSHPTKGDAFKISHKEAFLISSLPAFTNGTPNPIHIRTNSEFEIEKAIHSVLSMTILHYGSLRAPRLPVTIHYSDKVAYLALRGIKPKDLEGNKPFWL